MVLCFVKCGTVSVSNKWSLVHTLCNITDRILCLVYWAAVGKKTVVQVAMIYLVVTCWASGISARMVTCVYGY